MQINEISKIVIKCYESRFHAWLSTVECERNRCEYHFRPQSVALSTVLLVLLFRVMSKSSQREDIAADKYQEGLASIPGANLLASLDEKETGFKEIKWNSKDLKSSAELYSCYKTRTDVRVEVDNKNWKTEVPELCALLGMRHAATKEEVLIVLENSDAFQPNSVFMYEYQAEEKVRYEMSSLKDGKFELQISIPTNFHEHFANQASEEFVKLQQFTKQEIARVFHIPEELLNPEISVLDVKPGSVLVSVILPVAALVLILVGLRITQTPEWQDYRFKILIALGGAAFGTGIGCIGGPIGAAVGGVIGGAFGLGTASLVTLHAHKAEAKDRALLTFSSRLINLILRFGQ